MKTTTQGLLKVAEIILGKTNPRKEFDAESINELAASIKEQGVLQPILCRPKGEKWELVCGERRLRACKIAGLLEIPAMMREMTDDQALELQIIENLQRKDVHPLEEAFAYKNLIAIRKMDTKEISKRIGKNETYVRQRLKLNDLIDEFQKAFYENRMSLVDALKCCKITAADQKELFKEDFEGIGGKIEISKYQIRNFASDLTDAPFDTKSPDLKKDMGPCSNCRYNTASATSLFPETEAKATCMLSKCFKEKSAISFDIELKKSTEDPLIQLISGSNHSASKLKEQLVKKGLTVLQGYNSFEKILPPDVLERETYEEDLEDQQFDSKEEMEAQWKKDLEQYGKELEEYNKQIQSGKYPKAFIIDGDDAGKYVYIKITKGKAATTSGSAGKKEAGNPAPAKITKAEVTQEIERIRDREKRTKELDIEKITTALYGQFAKDLDVISKNKELAAPEVRAALIMMCEYSDSTTQSAFYKHIGLSARNDYRFFSLYKFIEGKTLNQLNGYQVALTRLLMKSKLQGSGDWNYEKEGKAAVLHETIKFYSPASTKKIIDEQMKVRADRQTRIESKISSLKGQLNEKPKTEDKKTPAKTKPAKKAAAKKKK